MRNVAAIFLILVPAGGWSQTFEVASIKPSPPPDGRGVRVGCPADPGRITCTNMTMANLVTVAYGIAHYQLIGLDPTSRDRFEIAIKIPDGATKDEIKLMWQNLLADRFKLKVHRETREVPAYELSVAKGGPKLQESVEEPPPAADAPRPAPGPGRGPKLGADGYPELGPGMGMAMMNGKARWRAKKYTTEQLANMLGIQLGQPVANATGLEGKYDFELYWATGGPRRAAIAGQSDGGAVPEATDSEGPTLIEAVQKQLGLKLQPKKSPVEVVIVDHVERVPTEN